MKTLVTICRIIVGVIFIFSGFIKANDPLGFSYKLDEYFEVFGTNFLLPLSLFLAIFMCVLEMILGFALLLGARINLTLWLLLLLVIFFGFLTFYSAYYDVVKSCGCFGDAIKLTPWQSFGKDMALMVLILIIFAGKSHVDPLVGPGFEKFLMIIFVGASLAFPVYTYRNLPVIDFRPYKIGTNIYRSMDTHQQMKFYYILKDKKTKELKEFESWPEAWDTKYDYVDSRTKVIGGNENVISGFTIENLKGEPYADEILLKPGPVFFLVAYKLEKTEKEVFGKVNDFATLCAKDNVPFIGLTSSDTLLIKQFREETKSVFDFYRTPDDVPLKTMIRANPGLVLLKDGVVTNMWHYNNLPSYNDVKNKYFGKQ